MGIRRFAKYEEELYIKTCGGGKIVLSRETKLIRKPCFIFIDRIIN